MNKIEEREEIELVFEGLGVAGSIYISNAAAAKSLDTIKRLQIVAILSAGKGLMLPHSKQVLPNYLYLPVEDSQDENLKQFFELTFQFIDKNRRKGNVLVHCYKGISRSATFIAAYLIRKYGYTLSQTVTLLRRKKQKINPNRSFIRQLDQYCQQIQLHHQKKEVEHEKIRQTLMGSLTNIKAKNDEIDEKIRKAHESVNNRSREKRSKSEYLKKRLEECLTERRSRQNSVYGESSKGKVIDLSILSKKLIGVS